jgi:hypothetical protein
MSEGGGTLSSWAGRRSMKTAAEYRVMAAQCCEWARKAYPEEASKLYLELVRFWLDVASRLDAPTGSKQNRA